MEDEAKRRYHRIHVVSRELLEALSARLSDEWLDHYRSLSSGGEWPELTEGICAELVAKKIPISASERDTLEDLLVLLNYSQSDHYPLISNIAGTMAALTVPDPEIDASAHRT